MAKDNAGSRSRRTEQHINKVAVQLMSERGYHGTSLRSVASAVGLQMSSLYYYYPSKQALLMAIMTRTMEELRALVEHAVATSTGSSEALRAAIRTHIVFHADSRMAAFVTDSEIRSLEDANAKLIKKHRAAYQQIFEDILRQGSREGIFEIGDIRLTTYALMFMCTGVAAWYRPNGRLKPEDIAEPYADLFLHGIQRREGSAPK